MTIRELQEEIDKILAEIEPDDDQIITDECENELEDICFEPDEIDTRKTNVWLNFSRRC